MKTVPDDILLPHEWTAEALHEDGMVFRRDDDQFTVSAVPTEECPTLPDLCSSQCWELRCRQRAGEATSSTSLGCVTTRQSALDTLLTYMQRINEAIESEGGLTPHAMIETLKQGATTEHRDRWQRTFGERIDVYEPSP